MKSVEDFYNDFEITLRENESVLCDEFKERKNYLSAKEMFIWLQDKSEKGELPREIEPFLTDFFYSMH